MRAPTETPNFTPITGEQREINPAYWGQDAQTCLLSAENDFP